MRVQTSTLIGKPPAVLWPLLCASKMEVRRPWLFWFGIPKPVECRLPKGHGGVGQRRECVSDRGLIQQRITHWEAPQCLRFEMESTTVYFRPCVAGIAEEFVLATVGANATRITRTTRIEIIGPGRWLKAALMWLGTKGVHRYVFLNWARHP
jgi:hypothetical protein